MIMKYVIGYKPVEVVWGKDDPETGESTWTKPMTKKEALAMIPEFAPDAILYKLVKEEK